jgi:hypothetical protein
MEDSNRLIDVSLEPTNNVEKPDPNSLISGTFKNAFIIDTLASYSVRSTIVAVGIPAIFMAELSTTLQSLIIVSPLIAAMTTQIPMTWRVNKSGGKTEGLVIIGSTMIGATALALIYGFAGNLSTINSPDWRYGIVFGSGLLIGYGSGTFQLLMDALKWAPNKTTIPNLQLLHTFIVDSAAVTTPIGTYYLGTTCGYHVPFALFAGLMLASELIVLKFLYPSPYNQLKNKFPKDVAKTLAVEAGQLPEMIVDYEKVSLGDVFKENLSVLFDRRSLLLGFSLLSSLGSLFITRTILPRLLVVGFGFSRGEAIIISSLTAFVSIASKPIAAKLISRAESESSCIKIFQLGCALTLAGMLPLATLNLSRIGLYCSLGVTYTGFGMNMVAPLSIATKWSKPAKGRLKEVNPSTMFGLFGTIGSLGGVLLPVLISLLVDNSGTQWYKQYYYIIMAMMVISAAGVSIIDEQLNHKKHRSVYSSPMSFFGSMCHWGRKVPIGPRTIVLEEVEAAPVRNKEIYVDAYI